MFSGCLILVVEDEFIVALDLADAVEELGGRALGPFATVREALECLDDHVVAGAILDATLQDRDITPVASRLASDGIPLIVYSGTGLPAELAAHWPDLPVMAKPACSTAVVERLLAEMPKMAGSLG